MAFEFREAPIQTGSGKLTIKFSQFFYLINFERTASASNFRGSVVLCPTLNHETLVTLTPSNPPVLDMPLRRKQVELFVAGPAGDPKALSKSGLKTTRTGKSFLPTSEELFKGSVPIQGGLLSDRHVPSKLNARFVLADGFLQEKEARCSEAAKVDWEFRRPGEHPIKRKLTDRLDYQLNLRSGQRYWLVVSNGQQIDEAYPLADGQNTLDVLNSDGPSGPFSGVLRSYAELHDEVLDLSPPGSGEMRGPDPHCPDIIGAAEPICGGEQGDPDPPVDPPPPPTP